MPNPLVLPIGPGLSFISGFIVNKITDHNRSELSISKERIENRKRMADGTLRSYVVAKKRKFSTSWKDLPRENNQTADGFWGAKAISDFYDDTDGSFEIVLTYGDNSTENVLVMFDSFNAKITKRSIYTDLYNIDLTLEEI